MLHCWKANPQERTTFDEMSEQLHQMYQQTTVGFKYFTKLITWLEPKLKKGYLMGTHGVSSQI